jgi:hypothetical protein
MRKRCGNTPAFFLLGKRLAQEYLGAGQFTEGVARIGGQHEPAVEPTTDDESSRDT